MERLHLVEPTTLPDVWVGKIKEIAADTYLLLLYRNSDDREVAMSVVASGVSARAALFLISDFMTGGIGAALDIATMMH
jgi:hypothetical protein